MSNCNYTTLSNEELCSIIKPLNKNSAKFDSFLQKHYPELYNELVKRTIFLNKYFERRNKKVPITARLYCIEHNLDSIPRCSNPNCLTHSEVSWSGGTVGFKQYCSIQCVNSDKSHLDRVKESNMKKYGVPCSFNLPEIREKSRQTNILKYGCSNYSQSEKFKNDFHEMWKHKTKEDIKDICDKRRLTNLKTYGVEYPLQSKEIQRKMNNTNIERYGVEWNISADEVRKTSEETMLKRYGVKCAFELDEFKESASRTMLARYGVEWFPQSQEYHKTAHKSYMNPKYPDMTFGSSWEFLVYDFLIEKHIEFQYQPSISFEYEYDGKIHTYHPDFLIGDKIFEVKGDNFFRINESTNKEEMYLPWKGKLSDEEYEYMCGLYEAKHQCMLSHNVIILRESDIKNLELDTFFV